MILYDVDKFVSMCENMPPEQWTQICVRLIERDAALAAAISFNLSVGLWDKDLAPLSEVA